MATLIVVRHGESEGNQDHRFIGQSQVPLTRRGRTQAQAVATRLGGESITRIVSSDLVRCVETVAPLARSTGIEIETSPLLREIDNGEWTGLSPEEISRGWPELWEDYVGGADVARPAGERWQDVEARVLPIAQEPLEDEGVVVVGTHSGPTLLMARWASGGTGHGNVFRGHLGGAHNGSLTVISPGPRLIAFNDVGHLGSLPDQGLPFDPVTTP
ncbi:MAG: histidine phosphatase family protein [Actinomycetota bacterium]